MTPPVRFGVLGCADIAIRRMLPAILRCPDAVAAAVASRDPATAAATAARFGAEAVSSYEAVLDDPAVDAVYLPLPAGLHADWIERALKAGKHVLAEKPLTTSYAQTRRLAAFARDSGLVLQENVLFVHHGQHATVRHLVETGEIGQVRALSAAFTVPARPPGDIRLRPDLGGGALWDTGAYPLRAAMELLGGDLQVEGAVLAWEPGYDVDLGGAALLRRADGVTAQLTFGIAHAYESAYRLTGSTGTIALGHAFTPPADHRPVIRLAGRDGTRELIRPAEDQCAAAVASFVAAVRDRRSGADDAVLTQAKLLDEIRRAGSPRSEETP